MAYTKEQQTLINYYAQWGKTPSKTMLDNIVKFGMKLRPGAEKEIDTPYSKVTPEYVEKQTKWANALKERFGKNTFAEKVADNVMQPIKNLQAKTKAINSIKPQNGFENLQIDNKNIGTMINALFGIAIVSLLFKGMKGLMK